ncbi:MAG: class IV adenylate cyclase [Spirochaetota bacterium]|jgi:predicted adenylyl cyclase CyaB|nr:class IV adenylate cyclase [Spirochaetota bacterium]
MAFEVEIKAYVVDPVRLKAVLLERYGSGEEFQKRDLYFAYAERIERTSRLRADQLAFRLRYEQSGGEEMSIVTAKKKNMQASVEINEEYEFAVSDPEAFCAFAAALGYGIALEKNKIGQAWTPEPRVTIELALVAGLGHFVEIENLVDAESAVAAAHDRVRALLASLGFDEQDIEPRYYTDMLEERRALDRR